MDQDQVSIHKEVELIFGSTFGLTLIHIWFFYIFIFVFITGAKNIYI